MLDIDTCINKLNAIKDIIGDENELFDSIISHLQNKESNTPLDMNTEYYKLLVDIGSSVKAGTVFYYDTKDDMCGFVGDGCLKIAWADDGNLCGPDNVIFHASMRKDISLFKRLW